MSLVDVILLEKVDRLGGIGDVVAVKGGFARNFLIPKAKALPANKENKAFFQREKEAIAKRSADSETKARAVCDAVSGSIYPIVRQASNTGILYGAVTARNISAVIKKDHPQVSADQINIRDKIKELGHHSVSINLFAGIVANITLVVARSDAEAKEAIKEIKDNLAKAQEVEQVAEYSLDNSEKASQEIDEATAAPVEEAAETSEDTTPAN